MASWRFFKARCHGPRDLLWWGPISTLFASLGSKQICHHEDTFDPSCFFGSSCKKTDCRWDQCHLWSKSIFYHWHYRQGSWQNGKEIGCTARFCEVQMAGGGAEKPWRSSWPRVCGKRIWYLRRRYMVSTIYCNSLRAFDSWGPPVKLESSNGSENIISPN